MRTKFSYSLSEKIYFKTSASGGKKSKPNGSKTNCCHVRKERKSSATCCQRIAFIGIFEVKSKPFQSVSETNSHEFFHPNKRNIICQSTVLRASYVISCENYFFSRNYFQAWINYKFGTDKSERNFPACFANFPFTDFHSHHDSFTDNESLINIHNNNLHNE